MLAALTACGSKPAANDTAEDTRARTPLQPIPRQTTKKNYETVTQAWIIRSIRTKSAKNELLVVSFGTSYNDSRRETIGAIENAMQKAFPDYSGPPRLHQPDHHRPCKQA